MSENYFFKLLKYSFKYLSITFITLIISLSSVAISCIVFLEQHYVDTKISILVFLGILVFSFILSIISSKYFYKNNKIFRNYFKDLITIFLLIIFPAMYWAKYFFLIKSLSVNLKNIFINLWSVVPIVIILLMYIIIKKREAILNIIKKNKLKFYSFVLIFLSIPLILSNFFIYNISDAAIIGSKKRVKTFLNKDLKQKKINKALLSAVSKNNIEITKLLLKNDANINTRSTSGDTALMIAAKQGNIQLCKVLLKKEPKINIKSNGGWTPLMYAAGQGFPEIVELLIKNGAEVNMMTGGTGLSTALDFAKMNNHSKVVKILKKYD